MPALLYSVLLDNTATTPPVFDGRGDYALYRRLNIICLRITDVAPEHRGSALVSCLHGDPKDLVLALRTIDVCAPGGTLLILLELDQKYALNPWTIN